MSAEDLLAIDQRPRSRSKLDEAQALITQELKNGERLQVEIQQSLTEMDVSKATMNRAKQLLGVKSLRKEGQWYWKLDQAA